MGAHFALRRSVSGSRGCEVKRQLGHASIELTVDTYGEWLPRGNKAAVDQLDDNPSGSKVVANGGGSPSSAPQVPETIEACAASPQRRVSARPTKPPLTGPSSWVT